MFTNSLALVALLGFFASVAVHVAAVCGYPAHEQFPAVWGLHLGVFFVFLPAIAKANRSKNGKDIWKHMSPVQMVLCLAMFAYTFVNANAVCGSKADEIRGDWTVSKDTATYTFTPRGGESRPVSRDEYMKHQAITDRMFSAQWMLFYLVAFSLLSSSSMVPKRLI